MTIVKRVSINNFKCLEDVDVVLNGKSVVVTGPNGSGKSSFIQAIWNALQSGERPVKPIGNHGDTAEVIVVIGDDNKEYTITLKYTEKKPSGYLSIRTPEGAKFDEPSTVIKQLVGLIDFDMAKFLSGKSGKDRIEVLKNALKIDTVDLDKEHDKAYQERTSVNREIKLLKPLVDDFKSSEIDEDILSGNIETPDDIQKKINEYQEKQQGKVKIQDRIQNGKSTVLQLKGKKENLLSSIEEKKQEIIALEKQILEKENEITEIQTGDKGIDKCEALIVQLETELAKEPDYTEEINTLTSKLSLAGTYTIRENTLKQHKKNVVKLNELIEKEVELSNTIATAREKINALFTEANINGIKIVDDEIIYNDLPLHIAQLNTAELTKIACRIVMGAKPGCKIMRFDASVLDNKTLKTITDEGKKESMQFFMEEVDKSGDDLLIEVVEDIDKVRDNV